VETPGTSSVTSPPADWLTPVSVSIPVSIFAVGALAYPLAVAPALGISDPQRTTWILGLYLLPAIASVAMTWYYKMPLIIGWSGPAIIFLASVTGTATYSDMLGAMLVTGVLLILLGASGLTAKIAAFIPAPIVFGVVAGSILPFLVNAFTYLVNAPMLIGTVLVTWLLVRRFLEPRVPAVLAAFGVGLLAAWLQGETGGVSAGSFIPVIQPTAPTFSLSAIITIAPVFIVLITASSNLSGSLIIKSAGFNPPRKAIDLVSGAGVIVGTIFGTIPLALATNLTTITTNADAGPMHNRHWSVYASAIGFLIIASTAAIAADLPNLIPMDLLLSVAALALLGVFIQMLGQVSTGLLKIGPVVALAVALSDIALLGFGALFWALVFGTLVTRFLEADSLKQHCAAMEDAEQWCR
jgi:benzoate membrane transport protein